MISMSSAIPACAQVHRLFCPITHPEHARQGTCKSPENTEITSLSPINILYCPSHMGWNPACQSKAPSTQVQFHTTKEADTHFLSLLFPRKQCCRAQGHSQSGLRQSKLDGNPH